MSYTYQQTFDRVVKHLRKQGEKAQDDDGCFYRIKRGNKLLRCAAGCLIPKAKYKPTMENKSCDYFEPKQALIDLGHDVNFVRELQIIHDNFEVKDWEKQFQVIAARYNLNLQSEEAVAV